MLLIGFNPQIYAYFNKSNTMMNYFCSTPLMHKINIAQQKRCCGKSKITIFASLK